MDEVVPLQLFLPVAIRFDLVDEDGSLLTPVAAQVALTISIQIQPADPTTTTHGIFPDPGVYSAALPFDITRQSDVHRQQSRHVPLHFDSDRRCFLAAAIWLMDHLGNVDVAIWAMRNHRLARLEMELGAIEMDRDDIRFERH